MSSPDLRTWTDGHFNSLFAWDECGQPDDSMYLDSVGLVAKDARDTIARVEDLADRHAETLRKSTACRNGLDADGLTRPLPYREPRFVPNLGFLSQPHWEWTPLGRAVLRALERRDTPETREDTDR